MARTTLTTQMTSSPANILVNLLKRTPLDNPILLKDLTRRIRSVGSRVLLLIYLTSISLFSLVLYTVVGRNTVDLIDRGETVLSDPTLLATQGRIFFYSVLAALFGVLFFLIPGFTASSIVGERERGTLKAMQVTLLTPRDIVIGKISALTSFAALLVISTMPLLAIVSLIGVGSVTLPDMIIGLAMVMLSTVLITSTSVLCSTVFKRIQTAVVCAYMTALVLVFYWIPLFIFMAIIDWFVSGDSIFENSIVIIVILLIVSTNPAVGITLGASTELREHENWESLFRETWPDISWIPNPALFLIFNILATCALIALNIYLSSKKLRTPNRTGR